MEDLTVVAPDSDPFIISVPKGVWEPNRAKAFVGALLKLSPVTDFGVLASHGSVVWFVGPDQIGRDELEMLLRGYYPDAQVLKWDDDSLLLPLNHTSVFMGGNFNEPTRPLLQASQLKPRGYDPLASLVGLMGQLQPGEQVVMRLMVRGDFLLTDEEIEWLLTQSRAEAGEQPRQRFIGYKEDFWDGLGASFMHSISEARRLARERVPKFKGYEERVFRAKLTSQLYHCYLVFYMDTPTKERMAFLGLLTAGAGEFGSEYMRIDELYHNGPFYVEDWDKRWAVHPSSKVYRWIVGQAPELDIGMKLSPDEIAAMWHLPHDGFALEESGYKQVKAPRAVLQQTQGVMVGVNRFSDQEYP